MQSTNIRQRKRGPSGSSLPREYAGQLSHGAGRRNQKKEGATPGDDSRVGPLVPCGECAH
jgi:hypothetical protein